MQLADLKLFKFALLVCVTCSVLLSGAASSLRGIQQRQVELDRKINVLKAFGAPTDDERGRRIITPEEVDRLFAEHIKEIIINAATGDVLEGETSDTVDRIALRNKEILPLYVWEKDDEKKYAFPTSGRGLWSTIYGFLALERNLYEVAGVTFYQHGETPGLGGEVDQDWYQDQFKEKKLMKDGEPVHWRTIKGGVSSRYPDGNPYAIDGISGATVTGEGVARFISEDFKRYNKYFDKIRGS